MANIPQFHYDRDWRNPADFPTYQNNEQQNRADLQEFFTAWENYWNNVVLPALGGASGGGSGDGSGDTSLFIKRTGDTMSGILRLYRDPQLNKEAATKQYVDDAAQNVRTDNAGNLSAIIQRADSIEALVQNNEGDISELKMEADKISTRVTNIEGDISQITQRADEIELNVANGLDEQGVIDILADQIALNVSAPNTDGERVYSTIALRVGPNTLYGQILMNGNVDISGELSADALYSTYGEIADLHVDYLETSRKIVKYLAGDTGDNNFIRAYEQYLDFVTGTTSGGTQQARNPNGQLLYWPVDVSGLPLGGDGYPLYEGARVFTTTTATEYPVMVYSYTEAVKRSLRFELGSDGIYAPVDIFGAGNSSGANRAFIAKTANAWDFAYQTSGNKMIGIHMHNEGFVDIDGLRKTASLDFSHFHEGYFTETVQGASVPKEYHVAFDNGVPTGITDESGNTLQITW